MFSVLRGGIRSRGSWSSRAELTASVNENKLLSLFSVHELYNHMMIRFSAAVRLEYAQAT
jgi:hypothetical protein